MQISHDYSGGNTYKPHDKTDRKINTPADNNKGLSTGQQQERSDSQENIGKISKTKEMFS
ncbi:unnamed protein product [marine sediment metagenome]|uniref:Uncharacterized protein n=1 Tax=marine sediment metagenome TaxID=412755 RepID=X1KCZ5_9ZZZZ